MKELYDLEEELAKMREAERSLIRRKEIILLEAEIMESEAKEKTLRSFQDSLFGDTEVNADFPFQAVSTKRETKIFPVLAPMSDVRCPDRSVNPTFKNVLNNSVPNQNCKSNNYVNVTTTPNKRNLTIDNNLMDTLISYNMKCLMPKIEIKKF